ncbi:thiol reductant ABC exporter subunit CydC [Actinotignum sp. SLA_B059]|uniref:thiol reductant ABC exporter subunit CydC n=1 Tax=Actinotignum sp. SLA_B059 TaxID=3083287 RepID=UPI002A80DFD5|nr:thiol reductant ABC exporter subunit CydC [Actinotignum sp. SLA_B059]MDY5126561.1 thiol reductant ABC exporter subunit CydC [Actinotignum sp. SLA_B059]
MSTFPQDERRALLRALRLLRVDKGGFWGSVAAGAAGLSSSVALAAVSAWLITRASQMPPVLALGVATTSVRFFGVSKALLRYVNRIFSHRVTLYGMSNLRTAVYATLADSPTDVVTSVRRGDLLARTGRDVDSVGDVVVKAVQPGAVAGIVCLVSCLIVGILCPPIGLLLAGCLLISGILAPYLAMRGGRIAEEAQVRDETEISATALTMLDSAAELRVAGRVDAMEEVQEATEQRIFRHRDAAARPQALAIALDTLAMGIAVVGAILIGSRALDAGTLSATALAVCVLTPLAAFEATQGLGEAAIQLVRSAKAAQRILELLDRAQRSEEPEAPAPTHERGLHATDLIIGWPGGPDVAGPFELHVERGSSIAIVGHSGIGKSTLLYTLAGMLRPHAGSVRLDGHEVSSLDRRTVSHTLTLTAEDAHVFETTVLENLRVARPSVTEREAVELLVRAGLGTWLTQLPRGVHTLLGEDAATISGGERRRLLLARALASDAEFLLLDEPGEHLDPETADELIRDLLRAGKNNADPRTIILVTHRLTPLDAADEVIVITREEGGIAHVSARGTHEELTERLASYAWAAKQE